jgi:hypothetical protein
MAAAVFSVCDAPSLVREQCERLACAALAEHKVRRRLGARGLAPPRKRWHRQGTPQHTTAAFAYVHASSHAALYRHDARFIGTMRANKKIVTRTPMPGRKHACAGSPDPTPPQLEKDAAVAIKRGMESGCGGVWHVVVGSGFGASVAHENRMLMVLRVGRASVLAFQSFDETSLVRKEGAAAASPTRRRAADAAAGAADDDNDGGAEE